MAALAAALIVLAAGSSAHPSASGLHWSKSGLLLAFWSESGLYAVNTVRGGVVRLTPRRVPGRCSPDGLKVAWSADGATYVHHVGTTGGVRVAEAGRVADWSPDSRWVLLESSPPGQAPEIYAVSADGKGATPLAPHPARDRDPTSSPDGSWIAFVSERDATRCDVWVVGWDGSHLTRVTSMFEAAEPSWSPDGTKLAFAGRYAATAPRQIYYLDFRTRKLIPVTAAADGNCRAPQFAGATGLRYVARQPRLADLRTGSKRKLPRGELSPDGTRLAVLSGRPGGLDVISLADSSRRAIDKGVEACAWSPDGRWLAYLSLTTGPTGGRMRQLRFNTPDARGVYVLWSEGLPEAPEGLRRSGDA